MSKNCVAAGVGFVTGSTHLLSSNMSVPLLLMDWDALQRRQNGRMARGRARAEGLLLLLPFTLVSPGVYYSRQAQRSLSLVLTKPFLMFS
jgi:hypothetical protein